jgi:hypothetical protein
MASRMAANQMMDRLSTQMAQMTQTSQGAGAQ